MWTHRLKILPIFYEKVLDGSKTFEIRKDDRGFKEGYTKREIEFDISHVLKGEQWGVTPRILCYGF